MNRKANYIGSGGIMALLVAVMIFALSVRAVPVPPGTRPKHLDCTDPRGVSPEDQRRVQKLWAHYLGRNVEETVRVNGVTVTFVLIAPGTFLMGSPEEEPDRGEDEAQHRVTLTGPFDLARTELTQAQYMAITGKANPSHFCPSGDGSREVAGLDARQLPVERVSWEDATGCAERLTKALGDGHRYRLPTEAEWEYACRGGRPSSQAFGVGDGDYLPSSRANLDGADTLGRTALVGSYRGSANALGLADMHGNVLEWCADWYGPYPESPVTDPTGPAAGEERVMRGGGWRSRGEFCRSARRDKAGPAYSSYTVGFRIARSIPPVGE
jgi:formylglycine-generating enzyme required for sulfatase activity